MTQSEIETVLDAAQWIAREAMTKAVLDVLEAEREQQLRDLRSVPRISVFQDRYWEGKFDGLRTQLTKLERRIEEAKRLLYLASARREPAENPQTRLSDGPELPLSVIVNL